MKKLAIIYWSGTGNTEKMAELIGQGAADAGAEVTRKHVADTSVDELEGYEIVALGSPSMGDEVVEENEMEPFVTSSIPKLKGKKVALFGSYGWGDGAWMRDWVSQMRDKGVDLIDDGFIVHELPEGDSADECKTYGQKLANA